MSISWQCPLQDRAPTIGALGLVRGRLNGEGRRSGRAGNRSIADQSPINAVTASMNDAIAAIALGRRIDLTRESDFVVGDVRIRPTACEVVAGGRRTRLQPRIMQVLVALARAGGEPLSREALIDVCWGQVT